MPRDIIILGFPKCGTTALMRGFEADDDIETLRTPGGALEIGWPLIRELAPETGKELLAHKFTAYVYNREALEYLAGANPDSILVLCIRDPEKVLISWRNMHRAIARSGKNPEHFAYKERDFYADCSIPDYYERFARRRLRYDMHFDNLRAIVPDSRIVVVSPERLAQDIESVVTYIKALARGEAAQLAAPAVTAKAHKGFADTAQNVLPVAIRNELKRGRNNLSAAIEESNVRACL